MIDTSLEYARQLDATDALAPFRERFVFNDPDLIYLDGNSLGRLARDSAALLADLTQKAWGERLIRSWNEGWWEAPVRIGAKIAQLIGAGPDEVIIADSTSVNLFKLAVAALRYQEGRTKLITDDLNFPSDVYIFQGAIDLLGGQHTLDIQPSPDGIHGADIVVDEETALVSVSHTVFKSGFVYDMAAVTRKVHAAGGMVLWDLSHSVGSVPVDLNGANADLAVGCTYKYLNGGPGAPAFLYVRRDLQDKLLNPISGWIGQKNAFAFDMDYTPTDGIRRFLTGTPPILSVSAIEPGVDLLIEAGMDRLRTKSVAQTDYLIDMWEALLQPLGYTLNSPRDASIRGSHVSLGHPEGLRIDLALINEFNILPDFRAPDNIRIGLAPIYTTFEDIHTAVMRMKQIVEERMYEAYNTAPRVT